MSTEARFIPFTQEADEFAVAWLLAHARQQSITSEQLTCALYQLSRIANTQGPRELSFQTMQHRTRWSRKFCGTVNQMLQAAGLIEAVSAKAGGCTSFVLGPEFNGAHYQQEVQRWKDKWRDGLTWPFTSLARTASRAAKTAAKTAAKAAANDPATPDPELVAEAGVGPQETQGVGSLRTQGGGSTENPPRGGSTENPGGGSAENPPLILLERCSLDTSLEKADESEPLAEVEPQASGRQPSTRLRLAPDLTASSPAEISEQPNSQEQPEQQQDPSGLDELGRAEWRTAQPPTAASRAGLVVSAASPATALDGTDVEQSINLVEMLNAVKAEKRAKREWWEWLDDEEGCELMQQLIDQLDGYRLHYGDEPQQGVLSGNSVEIDGAITVFSSLASFKDWYVHDEFDGSILYVLNDIAKHVHSTWLVEA